MECEDGTDNCSQICVEKEGGFSCACFDGFELLDNGASCQGTFMFLLCMQHLIRVYDQIYQKGSYMHTVSRYTSSFNSYINRPTAQVCNVKQFGFNLGLFFKSA